MQTTTRTVAVNAAFLQEIKEDNRELRQLLDDCGEMLDGGAVADHSPRELAERLSLLRDQLALHFTLEEAYGYFEDAITAAPRLCEEAERLRSQHPTLFTAMCEVVDEAERLLYHEAAGPLARSEIVRRYDRFHKMLRDHEARESDLILQAFDDDIGVGD